MKEIITIVFDIDGTLAGHHSVNDETRLFFHRSGAIIHAADTTHYLFPGIIQLMQLLHSYENVRVAFFSSGEKIRNDDFVEKLLVLSLGLERYNQIKEHIVVLSKEDMDKSNEFHTDELYRTYGINYGKSKKNVSKALSGSAELKNLIFIDDDITYIMNDHVKNFISIRLTDSDDFEKLSEERHRKPIDQIYGNEKEEDFHRVNSVYFFTGLLIECIENLEQLPIQKRLFELQFKPKADSPTSYKRRYNHARKQRHFYESGLERLRQFKPELSLWDPASFENCITEKMTEEETEVLELAACHEGSSCCVM